MTYRLNTVHEGDGLMAPSLLDELKSYLKTLGSEGFEPVTITYCNTGPQAAYHYFLVVSRETEPTPSQTVTLTPTVAPVAEGIELSPMLHDAWLRFVDHHNYMIQSTHQVVMESAYRAFVKAAPNGELAASHAALKVLQK